MGTRDELFSGDFDGSVFYLSKIYIFLISVCSLIIASEYDAFSIIEKYTAYLTGSASIVVYSPYVTVSVLFSYEMLRDEPVDIRFLRNYMQNCELYHSISDLWSLKHGCVDIR